MKTNDTNWWLLVTLWYGLLGGMLMVSSKFGHLRLSLLAAVILAAYGLLLFSSKSLAGKAHRYTRLHPWIFLLVGFAIAYTGDRWWFPPPQFDSISAEQDPFQLPLEIEGVTLNMTQDEVLERLNKEPKEERYYFGSLTPLESGTASKILRGLTTYNSGTVGLNLLYAEEIIEALETSAGSSEPDPFHIARTLTAQFVEEAKRGKKFGALLTEQSLSRAKIQTVLRSFPAEQLHLDTVLLVTTSRSSFSKAILLEDLQESSLWTLESRNLDILFSPSEDTQKVMMIGGPKLTIDGRDWTREGESLSRLNTPGPPLQGDSVRLFRPQGTLTFKKAWGESELRVGGDSGRIQRLEVWTTDEPEWLSK